MSIPCDTLVATDIAPGCDVRENLIADWLSIVNLETDWLMSVDILEGDAESAAIWVIDWPPVVKRRVDWLDDGPLVEKSIWLWEDLGVMLPWELSPDVYTTLGAWPGFVWVIFTCGKNVTRKQPILNFKINIVERTQTGVGCIYHVLRL